MAVTFPTVDATCVVPGSVVGAAGTYTARVVSTRNQVSFTDVAGEKGAVRIDGNGVGRRGWFTRRLDAQTLRKVADAGRACAAALQPPESIAVREIAERMDELAASRK